MDASLIAILGGLGKYKTTLMTSLVRENLLVGCPVVANYHMDWEGTTQLDFTRLLGFEPKRESKAIDEAYGMAEARISSSKLNRFTSYFVFQSRKLTEEWGADVMWSAQLDSSVDKRWFLLTPMKYACYGLDGDLCQFDCLYQGQLSSFVVPLEWFQLTTFGHFDSYKTVPPVGIEELMIEMEKYDYAVMNEVIDEACNEILATIGQDITNYRDRLKKSEVEDLLFLLGRSETLAKRVHNRLTSRYTKLKQLPNMSYEIDRKEVQKWALKHIG